MTIKFTCTCGKRLRAKDAMAARRTFCPRCGRPVGVPSGQSTARGTDAAPLTPVERQHLQFRSRAFIPPKEDVEPADASGVASSPDSSDRAPITDRTKAAVEAIVAESTVAPLPLDPHLLRLVFKPKESRRQAPAQIEKWRGTLVYPIRTLRLILAISAALAAVIALTVLLLPKLFELEAEPFWVTLILLPALSIPLTVIGYGFGYLESVLTSAAAGEAEPLRQASRNFGLALRSAATWLICFLAGPIVPAALAVFFWINSGDLIWIDWAILAELGVVAGAYWLFVMLSFSRSGRWLDIVPTRVFDLIGRLGLPAIGLVLATSAFLIAHVTLIILAVQGFHREPALGASLILAFLASGFFWATYCFRLLGVWCYRLRVKLAVAEEEA